MSALTVDSANKTEMIFIVGRSEIPSLTSVIVNGVEHSLGILKDFRKHPRLSRFLPEHGRLSLAWVHLEPAEVLDVHVHPTASMIVMCHGSGRTLGDCEASMIEGDIVAIPPGCRHGFVGTGERGLWALSIQFEGNGLYEDPAHSRVHFVAPARRNAEHLAQRNDELARDHTNNPLFTLIRSPQITDKSCRARLFDCIQVWSNCFHRLLLIRSATTELEQFQSLFERHLIEEFDHSATLAAERQREAQRIWDPVLDATAHWFLWKMLTLDNRGKTVLVHLVLETGAAVFHAVANPILSPYRETEYFEVHDEADREHRDMGLELLNGIDDNECRELERLQQEGWDMLNTLCARMATLAASSSTSKVETP